MKNFKKNLHFLLQNEGIDSKIISKKTILNILEKNKKIDLLLAFKIANYYNYTLDDLLKKDIEEIYTLKSNNEIKFLVLDIDGVLTDAGLYYSQSGDELKKFNAKDGLAIRQLTAKNFNVGFLSSGINANIIENRAKLLGVQHVVNGTWKKLEVLEKWCNDLNISLSNVAYIGDDLNDIEVIKSVGFAACPADASDEIKKIVKIVLKKKGGKACVREFIDRFLK